MNGTISPVEQIQRLAGLHRVFELFSLMKTHVPSIPFESVRRLIREALEVFHDQAKVGEVVVFTLPLPKYSSGTSTMIVAICHSLEPLLWSTTITNPKETEISVFRLAKKDPLFKGSQELDLAQLDVDEGKLPSPPNPFIQMIMFLLLCRCQDDPRGDRDGWR